MAVSRAENQITWATSNSTSISAGSSATSDLFTIGTDTYAMAISCKADNAGTPASGDYVDVHILWTCGDPDGTGADEYDSADSVHPFYVGRIDTNTTDPGQITIDLPISAKGGKVYADSNAASAITFSSTLYEVKSGA